MTSGPTPSPASGQRGSMAITGMIMLLSLVLMLGLVETGYIYWNKREAQKIADLASLTAAEHLTECSSGNATAMANAAQNGFSTDGSNHTITIACGWFDPSVGPAPHFTEGGTQYNAARVDVTYNALPSLFGSINSSNLPALHATAVARRSQPVVAFDVGTKLINLDSDAPLETILALIGVDLKDASLVGYQGLANLKLTPSGLLQALGIPLSGDLSVGGLNALLAANKVSLGQLLNVFAQLASQQGLANIDLSALNNLLAAHLDLSDLSIQLGSLDPNNPAGSLFASIQAPDATSALNVQVNALDLLGAAITIADSKHAVSLGTDLLGITLQTSVIEPPSTAIGPVGTRAFTSQIRLKLDVDTDNIPLIGILTKLLQTQVHVTLYLDLVDGTATVTKIDCDDHPRNATFDVESNIGNLCIGTATVDWTSTKDLCSTGLGDEQIVKLFNTPVLKTRLAADILHASDSLTVNEGETGSTPPSDLPLGDTVVSLVDQLLDSVLGALLSPPLPGTNSDNVKAATAALLAQTYLDQTKQSNGRYDIDKVVDLLKNGSPASDTSDGVNPLGDWNVPQGVPYVCGPLNLGTCWEDGDVWTGFQSSVTGAGQGLLGGVLGTLLGGLVLNNCNGLVSQLLTYNACVKNNLAQYLQTSPNPLVSPPGSVNQGNVNSCSTLLCALLKPLVQALAPLLNDLGAGLSDLLSKLLGINLGSTDVHVQSIQCHPVELVY